MGSEMCIRDSLDTATGERVIELLFDLNREFSTTLVLVTHDERLAQRCDRIIKLVAGEIDSDSDSSREERVVA